MGVAMVVVEEEEEEERDRGGGTQDSQGHCSPADKHREHRAAKVPSFRSGRGPFDISAERGLSFVLW